MEADEGRCLKESEGKFTSNDLQTKARAHLSRTIKARIEFDSQAETFDIARLKMADFKGDVSSMDTKELREKLLKSGVLSESKKKRNREPRAVAVNLLNVRKVPTKKVKGSRSGADSEEEDLDTEVDVVQTAAPLAKSAVTAPKATPAKDSHSEGDVVKTVAPPATPAKDLKATPAKDPDTVLKPKRAVVMQSTKRNASRSCAANSSGASKKFLLMATVFFTRLQGPFRVLKTSKNSGTSLRMSWRKMKKLRHSCVCQTRRK